MPSGYENSPDYVWRSCQAGHLMRGLLVPQPRVPGRKFDAAETAETAYQS